MLELLALECLEHPDMQLVVLCEETLNLSKTKTGVPWVNSAVDWIFFVEDFFVETETGVPWVNSDVDCIFFVEDFSVETETGLPWVNSAVVLVGNNFLQCSKKIKTKQNQ